MIQSLFHYLGISTLLFDDLSQLWRMIIYVFSSPISNKNMKKRQLYVHLCYEMSQSLFHYLGISK